MIPEILATVAPGIFAGAAVYINLVEQPARLSCGIEVAPRLRRNACCAAGAVSTRSAAD